MTITLTVAGRIATMEADGHVVAGNTYPVALSLDSEWTGSLYLRVRFGSLYYDIPFASSAASVDVQMPVGYPEVGIGVYSEALEICTNEARIRLLRSILEAGEQVVEFDGDLYDQWAGEVTTLLTDDAFDAESTRPVQNAVLTAWKDTVPLDANLVHTTGNETIAGTKTFSNGIVSKGSDLDRLVLDSTVPYGTAGGKSRIVLEGLGESGNPIRYGTIELQQETTGANARNSVFMTCRSLDGASYTQASLWKLADGTTRALVPSHLPVDSGGNHLAPTPQEAINSSMLAVDPRVVHTTGNESIAGAKTFKDAITVDSQYLQINKQKIGYDYQTPFRRAVWEFYDKKDNAESMIASDTVMGQYPTLNSREFKVFNPERTVGYGLTIASYADHCALLTNPYYPVDGSGNPQALTTNALVTSGNVAVDPRIVHTTGAETVAGNKTFTGYTFIDNPRFKRSNQTLHGNGEWVKFYEFLPVSYGGFAVIRVTQTYYIYGWIGAEIRIRQGTPTANPDARFYNMSGVVGKLAKRASDGVVEVWMQNTTTNNLGVMADMVAESGGSMKVATAVSQTAPEVGDTYSAVVDITNA